LWNRYVKVLKDDERLRVLRKECVLPMLLSAPPTFWFIFPEEHEEQQEHKNSKISETKERGEEVST